MDGVKQILDIFSTCLVATMKDMMKILGRSQMSVIRYLKEIGSYTSYNSAGEYYTLHNIPEFDSNGIWKHGNAYFSVHGSLKNTAVALVDNSTSGYTHEELRDITGLRMYNTLLDLAKKGTVLRREINATFVYVSPEHWEEQLEQRSIMPPKLIEKSKVVKQRAPRLIPPAGLYETIEVLVAFINGHNEPGAVYQYVHRNGINTTPGQVKSIFSTYELGKKNCTLRT